MSVANPNGKKRAVEAGMALYVNARSIAAAGSIAVFALSVACGGSSNKKTPAPAHTQPVGTPAAGLATATGAATAARPTQPPLATVGPGTVIPTSSPSAEVSAAGQKLTPLLLQANDLAGEAASLKPGPTLWQSNSEYVRGKPDAGSLADQLTREGRLGTVATAFLSNAGTVTADLKVVFNLTDVLAQYSSVDAARTGCAFVFSRVEPSVTSPTGDVTTTAPLQIGGVGDDFKAYRIDYTFTGIIGTPPPTPVRLHQVFYTACWRRGDIVATLQIGAINKDPSVDDFTRLVQAQDRRLAGGGQ